MSELIARAIEQLKFSSGVSFVNSNFSLPSELHDSLAEISFQPSLYFSSQQKRYEREKFA